MKREIIPRPLRACLWALLAIALAVTYYISLGCPTVSMRQQLRRAEKVYMVGPGKIVDEVVSPEYSEFDKMLVSETDHGIIFFGRYGSDGRQGVKHKGKWAYRFNYVEKTDDVTFAASPTVYRFGVHRMPVYVFTEHKDAVIASISITISGTHSYTSNDTPVEDPFHETFTSEATRDANGFFRFDLVADYNPSYNPSDLNNDASYALYCLSDIANNGPLNRDQQTMVIPVTIKLYDAQGQLILTRELTLGPAIQEA